MQSEKRSQGEGTGLAAALLSALVLTLGVRLLGFEWTFVGDSVVFPPADAQYHLRRAFYTFVRFPEILLFDSYVNFPGGAPVPWPPLFDFALGATARAFATTQHGFEVVAAWMPPALALLTAWPVYLSGRAAFGREVGIGALLFFALLPVSVTYTRLGQSDHHAAVALLGAWLLFVCMRWADPAPSAGRLTRLAVALFTLQCAMLLTWHGSLLYLALVEGVLLLVFVSSGERRLLLAQAAAAAASGLVVLLVLSASPTPLGGDYSSIALSRLHLIAMAAVALVCTAVGWWYPGGRETKALGRLAATSAWTVGFFALVFLLPGVRAGILPAFDFLTLSDGVGHVTGEQAPLLALSSRTRLQPGTLVWGYFVFLLPLLPVFAAWTAREPGLSAAQRGARWVALAFSLWFGALALAQRRYGNDLGPVAAILFAAALWMLASRLVAAWATSAAGRSARWQRSIAASCAIGLGLALYLPPLTDIYGPRLRLSVAALRGDPRAQRAASQSVASTLTRFLEDVRALTPESAGYTDPDARPQYGVIAHPNLGHAIQYVARRATATDPFWAYIGRENWERTLAFQSARDEANSVRIARLLEGRFVLTQPEAEPDSIVERLHSDDGAARAGRAALGHYRLVAEAEAGPALGQIFRPSVHRGPPYKLFEIVPGALIEVSGTPGEHASAQVELATSTGRHVSYRQDAVIGPDGSAALRVPYATQGTRPAAAGVRARGPYWVQVGGRGQALQVPEAAVRAGTPVVPR